MQAKNRRHNKVIGASLIAGLLILGLSALLRPIMANSIEPTARQQVANAIEQAGESGQYSYQTTVVQTFHPTLLLQNVGRTARVETTRLDGEVDVAADRMTFNLTAANNPPLQIKIEDGRGFGRLSEDAEWTEVELATELFAPGGDPMGFLAAAERVRVADGPLADTAFPSELLPVSLTDNITRYQFDVNGLDYANSMRDQLEAQLQRTGELPAGITVQLSQKYIDMTGSGEIWVLNGASGSQLPIRQMVQLEFPAEAGASEWVSAEITTAFHDWAEPELIVYNWSQDPLASAAALTGTLFNRLPSEAIYQGTLSLSAILLVLGACGLLIIHGQRRRVHIAINITLVISMLAVPLLQSQQAIAATQQVAAYNERQLARQQQAPPQTTTDLSIPNDPQSGINATSAAQTQPAQIVSSCVITATSDCDGDGLTDNVERYELGTNIEKVDTDGDGISDGREVASFEWFGTWTLDPLNPDSNGDGLDDGTECYTRSDTADGVLIDPNPDYPDIPCLDRDADRIPDVYDYDNDGDGVPDNIDLNPNASQVVTDNSIFNLDLVNAQTAQNIVVDLQIRPLDEQHLWWTNSILDWPDADNQGQRQRMTPNTLGNGDGDIQLMPMLEITIPYSSTNPSGGLPVTGTPVITATTPISTWLDTTTTNQYAMTVRLGPDGERIANLPLIEITDPTGGGPVGWQARIPYRLQASATDWGNSHQMRVIWFVNGQQDSCTPPDNAAANYCENSANWISTTTLLQAYPETFRITGLTVSEYHGATVLLAGQTPGSGNANYENELWHLADVMQKTWLSGNTVSSQRFPLADVDSSLSAWGLTNLQTSESSNLMDQVALFAAVDLTAVNTFIDTSLYPVAPISGTTTTVLMASTNKEAIVAVGLAVVAALAIKAAGLFGVPMTGEDANTGFYIRNFSLFTLPLLAGFFAWKRQMGHVARSWLALPFVLGLVLANIFPFTTGGHTEVLVALHLPIALWLAVGYAYVGGHGRDHAKRMDFVRFSGEWFIYYALIALGGGVLMLFTMFIFNAIGIDAEELLESWILPCGIVGAVLISAWLVEAKQSVVENMAPVLTRLFTPLFVAVLLAFLATMIWTRNPINVERQALIGFDLLLVLVLGLLLYSISARDPHARAGAFDALQLVLVICALVVDALALVAIAARISEFGFSPNKVAALGENLILLVNLAGSALLYARFLGGRGSFSTLVRWQTAYLPVYMIWAWIVVAAFPPVFGFV